MEEVAFAKLNLALHVRAREPDGYHRIETIFAFAEDGDRLSVTESEDLDLQVTGPFAAQLAEESDNLVLRAARALRDRFGILEGAVLTLDKRLPVASGLGGGSADAAAALRLLVRWWRIETGQDALFEISRGLGADVAACLESNMARGEGRGDNLHPLEPSPVSGAPLLLVNPGVPLSTAAVFRSWDGVDRGPLGDFAKGRNDLEAPAIAIVPEIFHVLRALRTATFARMSGSGATCFGLFENDAERDAAAAAIRAAHPGWWQLATRLR